MATKAKRQSRSSAKTSGRELDSIYFLKLVFYLIVGAQWVRVTRGDMQIPIPIGLIVGLLFARHDRFQIDRKVEYALLLAATFVGFWLPLGLVFSL